MATDWRRKEEKKDTSQSEQPGLYSPQGRDTTESLWAALRNPHSPVDEEPGVYPPERSASALWESEAELKTQTRKNLRDYLQDFFEKQPVLRDIASVLIPGALAAFLFPVFGPVVAAGAGVVAIKNGLDLLGITVSPRTTDALYKPFENKQLDGSDVQAILEDTLKNLLPRDEQVNEDVTKVVREKEIIQEIRVVALEQLRRSLETSLKQQRGMMAKMAADLSKLVECQ